MNAELMSNLIMLIKVVCAFAAIYIFIPSGVIRFNSKTGFLDRIFISLTRMYFTTILIVHLLVMIKLYDTVSLIIAYLTVFLLILRFRYMANATSLHEKSERILLKLFDMSDSKRGLLTEILILIKLKLKYYIKNKLKGISTSFSNFYGFILPILILLPAAYLRFEHSLFYAAFAHIDSYGDLISIKNTGFNEMYKVGVYPRGLHSIYSAINKLFYIDPYWLCRFIGPLNGVLILLSVFYFVKKITRNHPVSLVALVIYGLVNNAFFPSVMFRQSATLPQECALIFVLPGLYFLYQYMINTKRKYLLLYFQVLTIVLFIHSFVAFYLIVLTAVMLLGGLILLRTPVLTIFKVILLSALSAGIAFLPMGVGLLRGYKFHQSSIEMVQVKLDYYSILMTALHSFREFFNTNNPYLLIIFPILLVMIVGILLDKDRNVALHSFTASCTVIAMFFIYRLPNVLINFTLPELAGNSRTGPLFALILLPFYALGFCYFEKFITCMIQKTGLPNTKLFFNAAILAVCVMIILVHKPERLFKGSEEYDIAAEKYLEIKSNFPLRDWTIVSPQEQYGQVLGYGWHYQLYDLVLNFSLEQVKNPGFKFPMETHHTFIYVEKRPLKSNRTITQEDMKEKLEPPGDDLFMQYYKNTVQRFVLEAKAMEIAEAYMASHKDMSIYYEDENLRVYHIYQSKIDTELVANR